ncbi:CBS domain-containing protein [Streptomyces roseoverticillatus]|uniref:CBS domain-containing protein n=1 Tax=Streptomyces roseoverticillatus TaxID=66429 RepID=UPI00316AD806
MSEDSYPPNGGTPPRSHDGRVTVDASDDLASAYRLFRRQDIRRLPVLDDDRLVRPDHRRSLR